MTAMTDEELWTVYKQAAISGFCANDNLSNSTEIDEYSNLVANSSLIAHRERWPDGESTKGS